MINVTHSFVIICAAAICTILTRALPFAVFSGKEQLPKTAAYLGNVLPAAIMATLIVFCLKSVDVISFPHGLPELIAVVVVSVLHIWKSNTLLSIFGGTAVYMILIRLVG